MARIGTYPIVVDRVRKRLDEMFLGPEWLAKEAQRRMDTPGKYGCSKRSVWHALEGRPLFRNTIRAIADILKVDPRWLTGQTDDPRPSREYGLHEEESGFVEGLSAPSAHEKISLYFSGNPRNFTPERVKAALEKIILISGADGYGEVEQLDEQQLFVQIEIESDVAVSVLAAFAAGKYEKYGVTSIRLQHR